MTAWDKGAAGTAPRNHASWVPTGVSGMVVETKAVGCATAVVVARGGVACFDGLLQLVTIKESATMSVAYERRRGVMRRHYGRIVAPAHPLLQADVKSAIEKAASGHLG